MSARIVSPDDVRTIEALIDRTSLAAVLESIATIAGEKSEHIASNWQDAGLARVWRMASLAIDNAAESRPVREVSK